MLVLSRKTDQSIQINGNILIRVLRLNGNQVRLGIEAPEDVRILRNELAQWDPESSERASSLANAKVRRMGCKAPAA